jgi:hypothetical protein
MRSGERVRIDDMARHHRWPRFSGQAVSLGIRSSLTLPLIADGAIAAGQRGYSNSLPSCAGAGTVIVTILAGPLNYLGVNPKISCH